MRATPVVGLLRAARHNVRRGLSDLALFEVGRSYALVDGRPVESRRAAVLLHGRRGTHWAAEARAGGLLRRLGRGRGSLRRLRRRGPGVPARVAAVPGPGPVGRGRGGRGGRRLGRRPLRLARRRVGPRRGGRRGRRPRGDPGPAAPFVRRDALALPGKRRRPDGDAPVVGRLDRRSTSAVRTDAPAELLRVDAKYLWRGAGVPEGFVKTTLTVAFGSAERSLGRDEINRWRDEAARRLLLVPGTAVDGIA